VTGCFKDCAFQGYDMGLVIDAKDPGHMWASLTLARRKLGVPTEDIF